MTGGQGTDRMQGWNGSDTYAFNRGDGADTILDTDYQAYLKTDTLAFGAGITAANLSMSRTGYDLVVKVVDPNDANATDQITVEKWFNGTGYQLEKFTFADGASLTAAQIGPLGNVMYGTGGTDTLSDSTGSGAIYGLGGNDTISDTLGSDTLDGGEGNDTITDSGTGANALRGGEGNDTITFSHNANNTIDGGAGDDLIVVNTTTGTAFTSVNTIAGGKGVDRMQGWNGSDAYVFNRGDGVDTILDTDYQVYSQTDKLTFGTGITSANLSMSRTGYDLVVKVIDPNDASATDQITVEKWFNGTSYQLEVFTFADGTSFANGSIAQKLVSLYGTSGNDDLVGNANNNVIDGGAGTDTMAGGAGNDTYYVDNLSDVVSEVASQGSDLVYSSVTYTLPGNVEGLSLTGTAAVNGTGNALDNLLAGNGENNSLTGGAGNDTLIGGAGADVAAGGTGNDTYSFAPGDGGDTITENDSTGGNNDVLVFAEGIAVDQVWFRHLGNDLEVSVIGTSDKITVQNWYLGSAYHVEKFETADNKLLTDTQVENLVQLMGSYTPPALGQTTLPQNYVDALGATISSAWQ
jgi:Ca2+-binding RTX toxin-like protein